MKSERTLRYALVCFVSGTAIIAVVRFLYLLGIIPNCAYLDKAFLGSYITYSLFVVMAVVLLSFFFKGISTVSGKLVIVVLMVALVLEITQLNGRSGYLTLAVLSPWIFMTMFERRRLITVACGLLLLFALLVASPRVRERIALVPKEIKLYQSGVISSYKSADGALVTSSVGLHLQMWKSSLEVFRHHPLIGAGTNGYKYEAGKLYPDQGFSHPHNSYLYVAASYGLAGLALYGWLLVVTVKRAWQTREQLSGYSILAFLSVIMIGSLTDTLILSVAPGILLGFTAGIPTQQSSR
jgi:O-antigen ligase